MPYNPAKDSKPANENQPPHDRRAADLPINAQVALIEVDDPYAVGGERGKIIAIRSLRADPLAWMHAHHQLDEAQYAAGRRWQALAERGSVGAIRGVNFAREPVDGGAPHEAITDSQLYARRSIREASVALGKDRASLIYDVLCLGMFPNAVAAARGLPGRRTTADVATELRNSLDILAVHFGYAGTRPKAA